MDLHCQNCGRHIVSEGAAAGEMVKCPGCGTPVGTVAAEKPSRPWSPPRSESNQAKARRGMRRIFEPIPRPVAYIAGTLLILVLVSPFWIYMLQSGYQRGPVIFSDDSQALPVPPVATQAVPREAMLNTPVMTGFPLDRYRGLRLNASRDEVQEQFNLRLQNTRGMVPEIYTATKSGDFEQVVALFYNNQLKEFSLVLQPKRQPVAEAEAELVGLFGEPLERVDLPAEPAGATTGIGLPRASTELEQKLAQFPHRRALRWNDEENRVEATLHFTTAEAGRTSVMVTVHVTATRWLTTNQTRLGNGSMPAVNQPAPAAPAPQPLPRLFP
jgi:hypothetical protein